jgi:hypothetical protein
VEILILRPIAVEILFSIDERFVSVGKKIGT